MIQLEPAELLQHTGRLTCAGGMIKATLKASIGELVQIKTKQGESVSAEVIGFNGDEVQLMPLTLSGELSYGDLVTGTRQRMRVPVGFELLGRVVDAFGQPVDGKGITGCASQREVSFQTPDPLKRRPIKETFETGIRSIDGLITLGCGQRTGLFAGSGVGKSTLLGEIARHAASEVNVVALIGERGREVLPFVEDALGEQGMKRTVLIVSTSDQSSLARVRAAETAVIIASWFRDQGSNVLMMLDSLTRFAMARRELGLLLGEPPTSRGYTPGVFQDMAVLLEQLGNSDRGSITGLLTVLVDGDDMNDPVADAARSILDGHIVLDRKLAAKAHFPAIDVLSSASRVFNEIVSETHLTAANNVRRMLATYREVEDLIQIGAYKSGIVAETDQAVAAQKDVNRFLRQELNAPSPLNNTVEHLAAIAQAFGSGTNARRGDNRS